MSGSIGSNDTALQDHARHIDKFCKNSGHYSSAPRFSCAFVPLSPDYTCTPASPARPLFNYKIELSPTDGHTTDPFSCTRPVVSVIVPFFNTPPKLLEETILSLTRQSLQAFEVIIVDDGSTDTESIAAYKQWDLDDTRVSIHLHSSNRGLSAARNTGVKNARAPYILFLDPDDMIEPTTLEKLAWKLSSSPNASFAKGLTVGFGSTNYTWTRGFEEGDKFLSENQVTATIMFRKDVFNSTGVHPPTSGNLSAFFGYDESIVGGMEDWDFLLKCAERGLWGETIPEYLDWYRRKDASTSKKVWTNFNDQQKAQITDDFKVKYPKIHRQSFPKKSSPRLLLIVPWVNSGGADKFNLNLVRQMIRKGWEVTIVTTLGSRNPWIHQFERLTPDIFVLENFLTIYDYPKFICYLIESRKIDMTMVSNSEMGYLIAPYIRENCAHTTSLVDYVHMEEEDWKNGGFARYSVAMHSQFDMTIVSSDHLKDWMVKRLPQPVHEQDELPTSHTSKDDGRIQVAYINVDMTEFYLNLVERSRIRTRYNIPPGQITVLFAARLTPQKQPMVALEVFKALMHRGVNFTALVCGDGPMRAEIDEFVMRNGMSLVVKILGGVPIEDMPSVISASDIVFLPSKMEGISSLFYESMAAGVVPVGARVGGQHELITQDEGILVKKEHLYNTEQEIEVYRKELEGLISSPYRIRTLSANCKERIKTHFSIESMGDKISTSFCQASSNRLVVNRATAGQPRYGVGVGAEMALQAIESIKWQKQSEEMWRSLEVYRKHSETDKQVHDQHDIEKRDLVSLKASLSKAQQDYDQLKEEYDAYLKENESLFAKYEDVVENLEICQNRKVVD
eukprot:gene11492-13404_t